MKGSILSLVLFSIASGAASGAFAQTVKIVGIGAGTCRQYLEEVDGSSAIERNYLAWAQGYMSGILARAPAGVDETLDLTPPSFPLARQARFLRAYCANKPDTDFADAVQELYRTLRSPSD